MLLHCKAHLTFFCALRCGCSITHGGGLRHVASGMTTSEGFVDLLEDLLAPLGPIAVRRMFGGAGVYCEGEMFALISGDTLYFKTDTEGRTAFEAEGMGPFTYARKGGTGTLGSYWRAPERLFDEPDEMVAWGRRALAAAHRAAAGRKPSARRGRQPMRAPRGKRGSPRG